MSSATCRHFDDTKSRALVGKQERIANFRMHHINLLRLTANCFGKQVQRVVDSLRPSTTQSMPSSS